MLQSFNIKDKKSSALIEILVAITFFMLIVGTISLFSIDSVRTSVGTAKKDQANEIIKELVSGINQNKNDVWNNISSLSLNTPKSVSFVNNKYTIVDGTTLTNGITTSFVLNNVYRDGSGNVVTNGGTLDLRSRKVTFTASWSDISTGNKTTTYDYYINDWRTLELVETTLADFTDGTHTNTVAVNTAGGEIRLGAAFYPDWCKPTLTTTSYNLTGNGVAKTINSIPGKSFMGTGNNASGLAFLELNINPLDPPVVTEKSTFNGYKTNDVWGESNYAYLATDTNTEEIVILDLTTNPISKVGWYNAPGNSSAISVVTSGNTGYTIIGSKLFSIDITSKIGARSQIGFVNLGGTATRLVINGTYAYVTTDSSTNDLQIVNISNPASMNIVASADTNSLIAKSVIVNGAGTRAYLVADYSATLKEFFIIDTSVKSGARPTVSSFDLNITTPTGIASPDSTRAIIVGIGGSEQYTVLNISNEASLSRCGGTTVATGINGISAVTESNGRKYSYILTNESTSEFRIIEGGGGGGDAEGNGYLASGTYISSILDTKDSSPSLLYILSNGTIPSGTSYTLQVRTSANSDMSSPTSWMDQTGNVSGSIPLNVLTPISWNIVNNKRYIQYKFTFVSDTVLTPLINDITLTYQ